jgi:hypothetical protein
MKLITDNIKPILALIIVLMTYTIFFVVLFRYSGDNNAVSQVIIAVVGGFGVATGYYFGYSQGASKKDDVIASQSANPTAITETGDINVKK